MTDVKDLAYAMSNAFTTGLDAGIALAGLANCGPAPGFVAVDELERALGAQRDAMVKALYRLASDSKMSGRQPVDVANALEGAAELLTKVSS